MLIIAVRRVSKGKREAINQITFELKCGLQKIDADKCCVNYWFNIVRIHSICFTGHYWIPERYSVIAFIIGGWI